MKHCKNCGKGVHDRFCAHCGQSTKVERITGSYLAHALFHFFTHIERGFLHTSWQLVRHPGRTIAGFIEGKRRSLQPPVSYFLIWTTVFTLLLVILERSFGENTVIDYQDYFGPGMSTRYAIGHLSIVLMCVMPFQAFFLYLLTRPAGYNYFECLIAILYALGTVILFQTAFAVIAVLLYAMGAQPLPLVASDVFKVLYLSWLAIDLFRITPGSRKLLRIFAFLILGFGTFTAWRTMGLPALLELMP